jgi:hypothetical protein
MTLPLKAFVHMTNVGRARARQDGLLIDERAQITAEYVDNEHHR